MPQKLSDRAKKAAGTFRKGREAAPKPVADAQAAVAAAVMALEAAKKVRGKTARQRTLAADKVRILNDTLERALEDLTKSRAVPLGPVIRPGVAEMTHEEVMNADPPLTYDEELEWISPKATIGKPAKYRKGKL
jgi:hypothetical protein